MKSLLWRCARLFVVLGVVALAAPARGAIRLLGPTRAVRDAGGVSMRVDIDGATFDLDGHLLHMALRATGRGDLQPLAAVRFEEGPQARRYLADASFEWWEPTEEGIEHGVTLTARPPGDGPVRLDFALGGTLVAEAAGPDAIRFVDASGAIIGGDRGLVVRDADHRRLPATLRPTSMGMRIELDDSEARYPVVVDPLVFVEMPHSVVPMPANAQLGVSIAASADGSVVLVGAPFHSTEGRAVVLTRVGGDLVVTATIDCPGSCGSAHFGASVALSADGTRAIIGAPFQGTGVVYAFDDLGGWVSRGALPVTGAASGDFVGWSVAISGDGTRAFAGSIYGTTASVRTGDVRIWARSGTTWAAETRLGAPVATRMARFGYALAVDATGALLVVGEPENLTGDAYSFVRAGTTWTESGRLPAAGVDGTGYVGISVALTPDGSRAAVGAASEPGRPDQLGAARVYTRSGGTWALEQRVHWPNTYYFGTSVALSSDGTRLLVGAPSNAWNATPATAMPVPGIVVLILRTGTTWAYQSQVVGHENADTLGHAIALLPNGMEGFVGAPFETVGPSTAAGTVTRFRFGASTGTACGPSVVCAGTCVDGVCCSTPCGGGAADCQACSVAAGGMSDGTCTALAAGVAEAQECRAVAGACDVAEHCVSTSVACPTDGWLALGVDCRVAIGSCDILEECTGASAQCPADVVRPLGHMCADAVGGCDVPDQCDGIVGTCPDAVRPAGHVCDGDLGGPCDVVDVCDGASPDCTPVFAGSDVICRAANGACDLAERCGGDVPTCPTDAVATAGTICGGASSGPCDAPDVCTGTSADCMPTYLAGTECRASHGACDPAEVCAGGATECPPDQVSPAGTVCRAATSPACDPAESCDGTATSCPADQTTCAPLDAGTSIDASHIDATLPDAGAPPTPAAGCACRAATGAPLGTSVLATWLVLGIVVRRARRRG